MFAARNVLMTAGVKKLLSFTGSTVANASSITLPSHSVGDLILVFAARYSTAPTAPSAGGTVPTWTTIASAGGKFGFNLAYTIATSNSHTSGTWSTPIRMSSVVFTGQSASPIGKFSSNASPSDTTSTLGPLIPALVSPNTDGKSQFVQMWACEDPIYTSSNYSVPSGYTLRSPSNGTAESLRNSVTTKNDTTSDGSVQFTNLSASTQAFSAVAQVEIL
jgi:hypothetical protein